MVLVVAASNGSVFIGQFARLLPPLGVVAVSQAPSPDSNPDSPLPVEARGPQDVTVHSVIGQHLSLTQQGLTGTAPGTTHEECVHCTKGPKASVWGAQFVTNPAMWSALACLRSGVARLPLKVTVQSSTVRRKRG